MFITKVAFEAEKENEEILIEMAKKKTSNKGEVAGLISSECWKKENKDMVEYSFVNKWESKEAFKTWITRPEHIESHKKKREDKEERPKLKKTISQYELVDFE